MMRVAALFALLAVAAARKRANSKTKFAYPDPSMYMVEGQTLQQPGGQFQVAGELNVLEALLESATNLEASGGVEQITDPSLLAECFSTGVCQLPEVTYCPLASKFQGENSINFQMESNTAIVTVNYIDETSLEMVTTTVTGTFDAIALTGTFQVNDFTYVFSYYTSDIGAQVFVLQLVNRSFNAGACKYVYAWEPNKVAPETAIDFYPARALVDFISSDSDVSLRIEGISDFTIEQTEQGGFRLDMDIVGVLDGEEDSETRVLDTFTFGNINGIVCDKNSTQLLEGQPVKDWDDDYSSTSGPPIINTERGRRKRFRNSGINRNGRCPSYAAIARQFGSALTTDVLSSPDVSGVFSIVESRTFYTFTGRVPFYDSKGVRRHQEFIVLAWQASSENDEWFVALSTPLGTAISNSTAIDNEDTLIDTLLRSKVFYAVRAGNAKSNLKAQQLKNKEAVNSNNQQIDDGKYLIKFAQQTQGRQGFQVNPSNDYVIPIPPARLTPKHGKNKVRSNKLGTKNNTVNKKARKKARKERGIKNQKGGP